jgi:ribosome maturation factor RimP
VALRRHDNKRDAIENDVVEALEEAYCSVYRLDLPLDLLVGRVVRGVPTTYLLEVKAPGVGRLTKGQREFVKTWRGHFAVVTSPEEALRAVGIS